MGLPFPFGELCKRAGFPPVGGDGLNGTLLGGVGDSLTPLTPLFFVSFGLLYLGDSTPPPSLPLGLDPPASLAVELVLAFSTAARCEAAWALVVGGVPLCVGAGLADGRVSDLLGIFLVGVVGLTFKEPVLPPTLPPPPLVDSGLLNAFSETFIGGVKGRGLIGVFGDPLLFDSNLAFSLLISEAIVYHNKVLEN